MNIVDVRPIALTAPYGMEGAQTRERSAVFVEVETADGFVGLGETYLGVYMPELAVEAVRFFREYYVGRDSTNINRVCRDAQWIKPTCITCRLWPRSRR